MLEKTEINIIRLQENIKKEFYLWNEIQDHEDQGGQGNERRIFYYHGVCLFQYRFLLLQFS